MRQKEGVREALSASRSQAQYAVKSLVRFGSDPPERDLLALVQSSEAGFFYRLNSRPSILAVCGLSVGPVFLRVGGSFPHEGTRMEFKTKSSSVPSLGISSPWTSQRCDLSVFRSMLPGVLTQLSLHVQ